MATNTQPLSTSESSPAQGLWRSSEDGECSVEESILTIYHDPPPSPPQPQQRLGRRETRAVLWLKGVVLTVLVVAATIMGAVTFRLLRDKETEQFQRQFNVNAARLKKAFYDVTSQRIWVSTSMVIRYIANAAEKGVPVSNSVLFGTFLVCMTMVCVCYEGYYHIPVMEKEHHDVHYYCSKLRKQRRCIYYLTLLDTGYGVLVIVQCSTRIRALGCDMLACCSS